MPVAINGEDFPTEVGYYTELQSGQDLVRTTSTRRNSLVAQTVSSAFPGGWDQMIQQLKTPEVEVLGWCGYTWSAVVRPVGHTAKFSKTTLKAAYGREKNLHAVSIPIARSLKNICGIVLCDKTAHFRVAFYCPQHKVHLCNDHAV